MEHPFVSLHPQPSRSELLHHASFDGLAGRALEDRKGQEEIRDEDGHWMETENTNKARSHESARDLSHCELSWPHIRDEERRDG